MTQDPISDHNRRFGKITDFVTVSIEGEKFRVPAGLELLRCFQYLDFHIAYENFCWNASCRNCETKLSRSGRSGRRALCCQVPAEEGMIIAKLPAFIKKR
jgi:hypothetical protein